MILEIYDNELMMLMSLYQNYSLKIADMKDIKQGKNTNTTLSAKKKQIPGTFCSATKFW